MECGRAVSNFDSIGLIGNIKGVAVYLGAGWPSDVGSVGSSTGNKQRGNGILISGKAIECGLGLQRGIGIG